MRDFCEFPYSCLHEVAVPFCFTGSGTCRVPALFPVTSSGETGVQRLIVEFCRMQSGGRGRPTSALVKTQPLVAPAAVEEPLAPPVVAGSLGRPYGRQYLAEKLRSSGAGELQVSNHMPADSGHNIFRLGEVHFSHTHCC